MLWFITCVGYQLAPRLSLEAVQDIASTNRKEQWCAVPWLPQLVRLDHRRHSQSFTSSKWDSGHLTTSPFFKQAKISSGQRKTRPALKPSAWSLLVKGCGLLYFDRILTEVLHRVLTCVKTQILTLRLKQEWNCNSIDFQINTTTVKSLSLLISC